MRTLRRNKQKMKYALQGAKVPTYETDDDGQIKYLEIDGVMKPIENGYEIGYYSPVEFSANIAMSGGEAEAKEYGLDVSDYDATLVCEKGVYPITETSLIWHKSEVGYKDSDRKVIDEKSADYTIRKVSESLNFVKYILKKNVK